MPVPLDPQPGDRIGRWEVVAAMRRRGHLVYASVRPWDGHGGRAVLVMRSHPSAESAQAEAATLAPLLDLEVEGFETIQDLGLHGLLCWWVRAPLRGRPLDQAAVAIAATGPRGAALRRWGARAARILARLHAQGICHGAVGVEAVRIDEAGGVSLGGLREEGAASRPGTAGAVAPEQLAGARASPAADVYGLGAALHIALTEAPAGQDTVTTPWGGGARAPAPSPCLVRPEAELDLCAIIARALALTPVARPSAAALAGLLSAPPQPGAAGPRCPDTLGRDRELAALVSRLRGPGPTLTLLRGPAGSGRHQLVDAALRQLLRDQLQLLRVRAWPDRPGAAVAALLAQAAAVAPEAGAVGAEGPLLWTLWPELGGVGAEAPGTVEATALIAAATRVLARAAGPSGMVLCVDRLEQADPLTLRALARIARQGGPRLHVVALADDRSPPAHLRRWLRRLEESDLGEVLTLPDLDAAHCSRIAHKVQPLAEGPVPAPAGSPQRAVEAGHAAFFAARAEPWSPPPEALLPLALAEVPVLPAVVRHLGPDPDAALAAGWLVPAPPRDGVPAPGLVLAPRYAAWAQARIQNLRTAHDQLAAAIAAADPAPGARRWEALHRLLGAQPHQARQALALAAAHALEAEAPAQALGWLHTIDRLGRPRAADAADLPPQRALRARLRAALSLANPRAAPRPELLAQFRRRAQTEADHAEARILEGWMRRRHGDPGRARTTWRGVAVDPGVPPTHRARAAQLWTEACIEQGSIEDAQAAVAVARAAAQLAPADAGVAHRSATMAELALLGARGDARQIADLADQALLATRMRPLSAARVRLLRARASRDLDEASAAQDDVLHAISSLDSARESRALRLGLRVLQAHLALDRGAPERARQLLRQTHASLAGLDGFDRERLLARWWAAALRLATWCGEHATAAGLLQHPPRCPVPAEAAMVLAARMAYARIDPDRQRRRQTLALADAPQPATAAGAAAHADAAMACLIEGPRRSYHHHAAESRRLAEKAGARELILQARLLQTVDVKIQNRWAYLASRARTAGRAQLRADACALAAVLAQRTHDPGGAAQAMLQLHAELGRSRCDGLRPWAEALEEWLAVEETTQI